MFQFWANCKYVVIFLSRMDWPMIKRRDLLQLLTSTLIHYEKILPKQLIRHRFLKKSSPKKTKDKTQKDEKLRQKHNQRSGTGLIQIRLRFSFLIVVITGTFEKNKFIFTTMLYPHLLNNEGRKESWIRWNDLIA